MDQLNQFLSSTSTNIGNIITTPSLNLNLTQFNSQLVQWTQWHQSTWREINEIIQIDNSNQFSLYQLLTTALTTTKVALQAWVKFAFPICLFLFKIILHFFFFFIEIVKYLYKITLPYLLRLFDKMELAWDSLSEKTKMVIVLSVTTIILLFLLGKWISSLPFIKNTLTSWRNFKDSVATKYYNFIKQLQEQSLLLAQTVPHLLFCLVLFFLRWFDFNLEYFVSLSTNPVPLQSATTGQVRMLVPIGRYILFPLAIIFPIIASLYRSITAEYFLTERWIKSSMPKIRDEWSSRSEKKFISFYEKQYKTFFSGETTSMNSNNNTNSNNINNNNNNSTVVLSLINNTFLTTLSQSQIDYMNYWISLGVISTIWSLPLSGHLIDMVFQRYHYIPSFLLIWLLNPFTQGGNSVVTFLRPIVRLIRYIPVLNLIVSTPQLQLPDITTKPTNNVTSSSTATTSAIGPAKEGQIEQDDKIENHPLFRYIKMLLDLPVVPSFLRNAILQALNESGLLLLICCAGIITPTFITEILSLIILFLRPALAGIGYSTNLRSILQFQSNEVLKFSQEDNTVNKTEPSSFSRLTKQQAIDLHQTQLNTMKRLAIYLLFFSVNYAIRSGYHFLGLNSLPLGSQILLGLGIYIQSPFFPMSLFQAAVEPILRQTFISFHFNTTNIRTPQTFLLQKNSASWDKLFAPSLISPLSSSATTSTSPPSDQSGAFFAQTPLTNQLISNSLPLSNATATSNHLHFTSSRFQSGISTTVISTKNFTISPIVAAMCLGGSNKVYRSDGSDDSDDSDAEHDNEGPKKPHKSRRGMMKTSNNNASTAQHTAVPTTMAPTTTNSVKFQHQEQSDRNDERNTLNDTSLSPQIPSTPIVISPSDQKIIPVDTTKQHPQLSSIDEMPVNNTDSLQLLSPIGGATTTTRTPE